MPTAQKTNTTQKRPVQHKTVEEQDKVAKANLLRNQTRARNSGVVGYIIHAPAYGMPLERPLGRMVLQIHRHNYRLKPLDKTMRGDEDGMTSERQGIDYESYPGSTLVGLDGEWFTTDKIVADYVRNEYGVRGYTVTEVNRGGTSGDGEGILNSAAYLEAKAIMNGDFAEDDIEDYEEAHPDTPKILV